MANSEERYSLEDILAEFRQPGGANIPEQTAKETPPAAEPAQTPEAPAVSEEEMRRQEEALAAAGGD